MAGSVSVVVPLYNEEGNVQELHRRLKEVMEGLGRPYEIIYVDDGSSDETPNLIERIAEEDGRAKAVLLRRNYGQTAALQAGIDASRGEIVVTMDGDLQNDPEDIPSLLSKLEEGYDVVSGLRVHRQDPASRTIPSRIANALIARVTGVRISDYGCGLKAYRAEVLRETRLYGELHRFVPALAHMVGAKVTEIPVRHHPRTRGRSKYGLSRTPKVLLDLLLVKFLLSYRTRPLHLFGGLGLLLGGLGLLMGVHLSLKKIFLGEELSRRPALMLSVMLVLAGMQLLSTGILAELISRTYHESQGKPPYWVRRVVGGGLRDDL